MRRRARAVGRGLVVEARAKLNLALAVGPRRPDGFHDLATLFQSVSLADRLEIRPRRRGFTLEVRVEDAAVRRGTHPAPRRTAALDRRLPRGPDNLVLRAARLLAAEAGLEAGARFRLVKRIPAGAGLGGGSADAAAALMGLRRLHRLRLSRAECLALAARLGSDVPFAIAGGTAVGLGRGERLAPARLARPFRALLAVPAWRVATPAAFSRIDRRKNLLTVWQAKLRSTQILGRKRLSAESWMRLGNVFEEVLGSQAAHFGSLRERLRAAGALEVRMTGSGSAVFGVLDRRTAAREAVRRFEGTEALYVIRSRAAGLLMRSLPEA